MVIVITTKSTKRSIVGSRYSETHKVRPDCLHSYTKGGTKGNAVNAALVDLNVTGCRAKRWSDLSTINLGHNINSFHFVKDL